MKVFKFTSGNYFYVVSGNSENEAKTELMEYTWDNLEIDSVEEIPESKWDEKTIEIKDGDYPTEEVWNVSIRDLIEDTPIFICSNDPDLAE